MKSTIFGTRCAAFSVALSALALLPLNAQAQAPATPAAPPAAPAAETDAALALVGKPAPDFILPDQNDQNKALAASKGKWVVLAFYPADMTTGCTFQNRSYTNNLDKFAPLNAVVYTVSTQNTASKKEFCSKEGLKHALLSDVGGNVAKQYGVLRGPVARRVTFYIAPDGTVAQADTQINTRNAADESLGILKNLSASAPQTTGSGETVRTTVGGVPAVTKANNATFVGSSAIKVAVGGKVPDFGLTDVTTGKTAAFTTLAAGKKATVIVFNSTQCPVSRSYDARLAKLAASYGAKGVQFIAINSNQDEQATQAAAHAKTAGLTFPVLKDDNSSLANQFNVQVTPEVFVTDAKGVVLYHGPVDNNKEEAQVSKQYLANALDAVLAGKPVAVKSARVFGCALVRSTGAK